MGLTSPSPTLDLVVWHDLECGGYDADLPLWRALADEAAHDGHADVLDLGAGTGRVSLDLARHGHRVTALDVEAGLLHALGERAHGLDVRTVCADARSFDLAGERFDLCLVPMQTIQLLAGASERVELMRAARRHLRPGGLLACAIVTELDPFDARDGREPAPPPERTKVDGVRYESLPVRVAVEGERVVLERERWREGCEDVETDATALAVVSAEQLAAEGRRAGLEPAGVRHVAETDQHSASEVAMLRA